jgi:hypothetical protein
MAHVATVQTTHLSMRALFACAPAVKREAEEDWGDADNRAVDGEYCRLILEKYGPK